MIDMPMSQETFEFLKVLLAGTTLKHNSFWDGCFWLEETKYIYEKGKLLGTVQLRRASLFQEAVIRVIL